MIFVTKRRCRIITDNEKFMVNELMNIVAVDGGYKLQNAFKLNEDNRVEETEESILLGEEQKNCYRCVHSSYVGQEHYSCDINNKLRNVKDRHIMYDTNVWKCQARKVIEKLNIIKSEKEMVDFISDVFNFFGCPEDIESYFGFKRRWNEDTGEILETVREYYNRGGEFSQIPDKYPCAIYFDEDKEKLEWVAI